MLLCFHGGYDSRSGDIRQVRFIGDCEGQALALQDKESFRFSLTSTMKIGYTIFVFHKTDAKRQIFPGRRALKARLPARLKTASTGSYLRHLKQRRRKT